MFYLERVEVFLEYREYEFGFRRLAERLSRQGIVTDIRDSWEEEDGEAEGIPSGVLRITDSSRMLKELLEKGYPALVYFHERNRGSDFNACRYACEDPEELDAVYLDRIYRRFLRLPWDILETVRCRVRETTEEDVEKFYQIYAEPSVTEYMENLYADPEEERAYARDYIDQVYGFYEFGIWTVVKKDTDEVIGRAGICYREGYADPEIGFLIAVPYQRQGFAEEVCSAVLNYAREALGFLQVLAFVQPENKVSVHLCEKLGMMETERVRLQEKDYLIFRTSDAKCL